MTTRILEAGKSYENWGASKNSWKHDVSDKMVKPQLSNVVNSDVSKNKG